MKRAYIVLNPVSGTDDPQDVRELITQYFDAQDWAHEIYTTTGEEQVADVVRKALKQDFDLCVAAGGDGTVAGVASGLVHSQVPLGIVPSGTGNALARELKIPMQQSLALEIITGSHTLRSFDALQVQERFFFLNLSFGVSAQAMLDAERQVKRKFGVFAYVWSGLKRLVGFQPYKFELDIDGQTYRFRASEIVVANSAIVGLPALRIAPDVRFDDGRFNVCIVRANTLWDYLKIGWDMLLGHQKRNPHLRFLEAKHSVSIRVTHPVPIQADGEFIGRGSIDVSLVPQAVQIIAPTE